MKEKISGLSIKARLILFSLCISLIPIALITTVYYLNAINELRRNKFNELRAVGELRKLHILTFMQAKRDLVVNFSSDGFIRDAVKKINELKSPSDVVSPTFAIRGEKRLFLGKNRPGTLDFKGVNFQKGL